MPEVTIRYFAAARAAAGESTATADAASIRELIATVSTDTSRSARGRHGRGTPVEAPAGSL